MPHWKCVLLCCHKCPSIVITSQKANKNTPQTYTTIRFHVYKNKLWCNFHEKMADNDRIICDMCTKNDSVNTMKKNCTHKKLVLLKTSIIDFKKKA